MALRVLNLRSAASRAAVAACCIAAITLSFLFAKWCLADALSTHAEERQAAELAVSLGPSDPQTHFAAAVIYDRTFDALDQGRSLDEYRLAAVLSPNNYLAWLSLAEGEDRFGNSDKADAAFRRSLELAPNYAAVQWSYGNFLVRTHRAEEGFPLISRAASADPSKMPSAISMVLSVYDGDTAKTRAVLGNTGEVNIALASGAIAAKDAAKAFAAWTAIDQAARREQFETEGRALASQFVGLKQFRMAARVLADVTGATQAAPFIGVITNGGFEKIDPANTNIFDWQLSAVTGQQIGLSEERKVEGGYSLFMVFNTMKAAEFRQLSQTVAVEPAVTYTLSGSYRSELKGGVAWEAADAADGKVLGRAALQPASADWTQFQTNFSLPASDDGVVIRLVRDGCMGEVCPISGKLWLDAVSIQRQK
jgi:tetratricopeptide (TPR) repeat protein